MSKRRRANANRAAARKRRATVGRGRALQAALTKALNERTAGFLGMEMKFYDTSLVASALTAPADSSGGEHDPSGVITLNTVTQGDGESQRDGRKIIMKSIMLKGHIDVPAQADVTATDDGCKIMIALVLDTQTNGATISSENVFSNPSANSANAPNVFNNLQYSKRFRILKRLDLVLNPPPLSYDGTNIEMQGMKRAFKIYKTLNDIVVNYTANTENVANIVDNSLHVIAFCNEINMAPTINYNARLRFVG